MTMNISRRRGFIALIAVVILASGVLAFSLAAMSAAAAYASAVEKKELRIQAGLNLNACLDYAELMAAKNYYLNGESTVREFGCALSIANDDNGGFSIAARSTLEGVSAYGNRSVHITWP